MYNTNSKAMTNNVMNAYLDDEVLSPVKGKVEAYVVNLSDPEFTHMLNKITREGVNSLPKVFIEGVTFDFKKGKVSFDAPLRFAKGMAEGVIGEVATMSIEGGMSHHIVYADKERTSPALIVVNMILTDYV